MEDRYISRRLSGVGDVSHRAAQEGIGVAAGFGVAGYTGSFFESRFKPGVDAFSSTGDKLTALAVNNVPKLALWLGMRMKNPGKDMSDMMWADAQKGVIGNVGLDVFLRAVNHLAPPDMNMGRKVLGQKDAQRLIQENTALRENYNKALAKLSEVTGMQIQAPKAKLATPGAPGSPAGGELQTPRQKKYAFMPGPAARQRKYNFMGDVDEKSVAAAHGML